MGERLRGPGSVVPAGTPVLGAWVVGDAPTVRGFELAGFRGILADTGEAVRSALAEARSRGVRLVVLTERAAALAPDVLEPGREHVLPLLAVVPSLVGEDLSPPPGARVRRAVRRALGVSGLGVSGTVGR